jgi:hypothetical protein
MTVRSLDCGGKAAAFPDDCPLAFGLQLLDTWPHVQPGRRRAELPAQSLSGFSGEPLDRLPRRPSGELSYMRREPVFMRITGERVERASCGPLGGLLEQHPGAYPELSRVYPGDTPGIPSKSAYAKGEDGTLSDVAERDMGADTLSSRRVFQCRRTPCAVAVKLSVVPVSLRPAMAQVTSGKWKRTRTSAVGQGGKEEAGGEVPTGLWGGGGCGLSV